MADQRTSTAEDLLKAMKAMQNAAEAMSKAAESLNKKDPESPREPGRRPGPSQPTNSVPAALTQDIKPDTASVVVGSVIDISTRVVSTPAARNSINEGRDSRAIPHIDLLEAVSKLNLHKHSVANSITGSRLRDYGEGVADRNLGGLMPPSLTNSDSPIEDRGLEPIVRDASDHAPHFSLLHEIGFVATICMAHFLTQAGFGQAIAPLHIIGLSFNSISPGNLSWYASAYALTVGTFILPSGRLGDIYGHKLLFVIGWLWFGFWSLLAGFSTYVQNAGLQGEIFFCFCRAMQGIGPALLLPNALAILGRTYPQGRRKHMIFALFGAAAPSGFVVGTAMSSLFAQKASWPWGYWVMGAVCVGLSSIAILIVPSSSAFEFRRKVSKEEKSLGWRNTSTQLDLPGMILGVSGLVLINFAWNQGPVVGWTTPYAYFILLIGFLILITFFYAESVASNPILPLAAINRDTSFVLGCMAAGWSSFGIWVFYSWNFLEIERHVSPLLASAMFAPVSISALCASMATGVLLSKLKSRYIMLLSMCAFFTGSILAATAPIKQSYWCQIFLAVLVMPWGMDMSFPSATVILSDRVGRERQGIAASLVNTVINYSISIGLGVAGTIERNMSEDGRELEKGFRSAQYMGVGLSGLGIVIAWRLWG